MASEGGAASSAGEKAEVDGILDQWQKEEREKEEKEARSRDEKEVEKLGLDLGEEFGPDEEEEGDGVTEGRERRLEVDADTMAWFDEMADEGGEVIAGLKGNLMGNLGCSVTTACK